MRRTTLLGTRDPKRIDREDKWGLGSSQENRIYIVIIQIVRGRVFCMMLSTKVFDAKIMVEIVRDHNLQTESPYVFLS